MPSFENYLILPKSIAYPLLKLRTTFHNQPVGVGQWINIPKDQHVCTLCNSPSVADEFHYTFRCEAFVDKRLSFIPEKYLVWSNVNSFKCLITTTELK